MVEVQSDARRGRPADERDLVPGDGAALFDTRFSDWVAESAART